MSLHRPLLIFIIITVCICAILTIAQIWTLPVPVMDWWTYIKLMATAGILVGLSALVMVLRIDLSEHKKLKDQNYLD